MNNEDGWRFYYFSIQLQRPYSQFKFVPTVDCYVFSELTFNNCYNGERKAHVRNSLNSTKALHERFSFRRANIALHTSLSINNVQWSDEEKSKGRRSQESAIRIIRRKEKVNNAAAAANNNRPSPHKITAWLLASSAAPPSPWRKSQKSFCGDVFYSSSQSHIPSCVVLYAFHVHRVLFKLKGTSK